MTSYALRPTSTAEAVPDSHRLRFGSTALLVGLLSQLPLGTLHPHGEQPNDSVAAFHEYAHSDTWVLVHLGQFAGLLLATIGIVTIAAVLTRQRGAAGVLGLVAGVTAVVSAAVFAVQMAVDGVALKAAVDAWESARGTSHSTAACAVADSVRSVEKGLSAVFNITNGLTLTSLGLGLATSPRPHRWLGGLAAVGGAGPLAVGVVTAQTGFSPEASTLALPASVALAAFGIGMTVTSWRRLVTDQWLA